MNKMIQKRQILNILHQSNDGYTMVCATSIVSLLENNKCLDEINIYYLGYKISEENQKKLNVVTSSYLNCHLFFIDAEKYHNQLEEMGVSSWRGLYVTWLKLLALNDLMLNTDRILYINAHTIVNSSLDELIDIDFEDNVMGLSYDCILNDHKNTLGLRDDDGYFNCGVMLINHKKWMKENIDREVRKNLKEKSNYVIVDQDFCNVVFKNRIKVLDSTYNFSSAYYGYDLKGLIKVNNLKSDYFYTYENLMSNYYSPKIVHSLFGIVGKPWEDGNKHPQRYLWRKYIDMTPWKDFDMPKAKYNINWFLYDLLPQWLFLRVYKFAVKSKYGKKTRNKFIVMIFDLFTPQKGT